MDTNVPLIARMTTADAAKNFPGKSRKTALGPCHHQSFRWSRPTKADLGFSVAFQPLDGDSEALHEDTRDAIIRCLRNPIRTQKSRVAWANLLHI